MLNEIALYRLKGLTRSGPNRLPKQKSAVIPSCQACSEFALRRRKRCKHCAALRRRQPVIRFCRLCEGDVSAPRRSWCGDECQDAYYYATSGTFARAKVWERDQGRCAWCSLDCAATQFRIHQYPLQQRAAAYEYLRGLGFSVADGCLSRTTLWDADHIEALAEGGSNYELSNLQTLCQICHKAKTAEHAARRGTQRRILGRKWVEQRRRQITGNTP